MRNMGSKIPNFTLETEKSKPPTSSSVSTCMLMYYTSYCKNQPVIMVICLSWTRAASLKHQIYDKLLQIVPEILSGKENYKFCANI